MNCMLEDTSDHSLHHTEAFIEQYWTPIATDHILGIVHYSMQCTKAPCWHLIHTMPIISIMLCYWNMLFTAYAAFTSVENTVWFQNLFKKVVGDRLLLPPIPQFCIANGVIFNYHIMGYVIQIQEIIRWLLVAVFISCKK